MDALAIGEIRIAPYDVHVDPFNTYQPDLLYVSNERRHIFDLDGRGITGAPDVVVEILSDSTRRYDPEQQAARLSQRRRPRSLGCRSGRRHRDHLYRRPGDAPKPYSSPATPSRRLPCPASPSAWRQSSPAPWLLRRQASVRLTTVNPTEALPMTQPKAKTPRQADQCRLLDADAAGQYRLTLPTHQWRDR